jgi:hypothetical protein
VPEEKDARTMFVLKFATPTQTVKLEKCAWKGPVTLDADQILTVKLLKFVFQTNVGAVLDLNMVLLDAEISTSVITSPVIPARIVLILLDLTNVSVQQDFLVTHTNTGVTNH